MGYRWLTYIAIRHSKLIIGFWVAFLILFGSYATGLPSILSDHGLMTNDSYRQVQSILSSEFGMPEDPVIVVYEKDDYVTDKQFRAYIASSLYKFTDANGLNFVISPLEQEGMIRGNLAYVLLGFQQPSYEIEPVLLDLKNLLPTHPNISVTFTGKAVVQADVNEASQHDLKQAELLGLPIAFIILIYAFGGVLYAIVPIILGLMCVTSTMGIMYWIGQHMELSNFVLNVIPMVGLALCIDFALLIISRYREERSKSNKNQTLLTTLRTAGRAVVFSGICVVLGLLSILFIKMPMFASVTVGAITVLVVAVLLNMTLLPAILSLLDPINSSSKSAKECSTSRGKRTIWVSWSALVMRKPVIMTFLAICIVGSLLLPVSQLKLSIPDSSSLPPGYESRAGAELYQAGFTVPDSSHIVLIAQGNGNLTFTVRDWIAAYDLVHRLERVPGVIQVQSIFDTFPITRKSFYSMLQVTNFLETLNLTKTPYIRNNHMIIHLDIQGKPGSKEAGLWLRHWESMGRNTDLPFIVGGEAKYQQEVFDRIYAGVPKILVFISVSNFIVLMLAFRSLLIPLKAILMNLLSLGASFGILVVIFQRGTFGMEPTSVAVMIPVFIFGLAFGISMDYGVFLLSRISELYEQTGDSDIAVQKGLASTSRIITSAAAILIAVTLPFALGSVVGVKQLGVGIATAIFIDATLVRLVLVPALMKLFGRWNWWLPGDEYKVRK